MKIHALARFPHYMDHLLAIWNNLPDHLLGETLLEPNPTLSHVKHWDDNDLVMVAGYSDIQCAFGRRIVYVEHGAGQKYEGVTAGAERYYHGSEHPDNVIAYLGPRQDVIDSWQRPGYACGAPICDRYQLFSDRPVVAIAFHWNAGAPHRVGVPEAGTAFDAYQAQMSEIIAELHVNNYEVVGTRHPRFNRMRGFWERQGVEEVDAHHVRLHASLLIADNTSLAYEMAYLNRDVITLNCPEYRRDVNHGLRFWDHIPGLQVNDPFELIDVISELDTGVAGVDPDICRYVYGKPYSDGRDGWRAAAWLSSFAATL